MCSRVRARVQVGAYAFTTVRPQLGAMRLEEADVAVLQAMQARGSTAMLPVPPAGQEDHVNGLVAGGGAGAGSASSLVLADIPGLVEGAGAAGRGRGADFLAAVERCRAVLYVVDLSGGGGGGSGGSVGGGKEVEVEGECMRGAHTHL